MRHAIGTPRLSIASGRSPLIFRATIIIGALMLLGCKNQVPAKGDNPVPLKKALQGSGSAAAKPAAKENSTGDAPKVAMPTGKVVRYKPNKRFPGQRNFRLPIPFFAPNSAWNLKATKAKVVANSAKQILATYRAGRKSNWELSAMDINYDEFAISIYLAGKKRGKVLACNYDGEPTWGASKKIPPYEHKKGGTVIIPMPDGTVTPAGPRGDFSDGWLVMLDFEKHREWDFWQATTKRKRRCKSSGGGIPGKLILEAGFVDRFDYRGSGTNYPQTESSARAMGTALLAGLVVPEDIESGVIAHALAMAIPKPRNRNKKQPDKPFPGDHIYPAAFLETDHFSTDPYQLAGGQRLRLKKQITSIEGEIVDETKLAPITRMFLKALRQYGAYIVDAAGGFTFFSEDITSARVKLTDAQVNKLIGEPADKKHPKKKSRWELLMSKLTNDIGQFPIAFGIFKKGQNPKRARYKVANFDVVDSPPPPKK